MKRGRGVWVNEGRDERTGVGDLRKDPSQWRFLLWALDLGLVLYECFSTHPAIRKRQIIGRKYLGQFVPWMALSSLKDRQYSYSSQNEKQSEHLNPSEEIGTGFPSLQSMEGTPPKQAWRCGSNKQTTEKGCDGMRNRREGVIVRWKKERRREEGRRFECWEWRRLMSQIPPICRRVWNEQSCFVWI